MNKIPTTEEILSNYFADLSDLDKGNSNLAKIEIAMKDYAKLHVEAALKSASREVNLPYKERTRFILNAYPLNNIK